MYRKSLYYLSLIALVMTVHASYGLEARSSLRSGAPTPRMKPAAERLPLSGGESPIPFRSLDTASGFQDFAFLESPEDSFVGQRVGVTWFDYQHNGSMGRQIARGSDGRVHFAWTYIPDTTSVVWMRFVHFNSVLFSGGEWQQSHPPSGIAVSGLRGGFANADVFGDQGAVSWHEGPSETMFSANVGLDIESGAGFFITSAAPLTNCTGTTSNGEDGVYLWPHMQMDVDTGAAGEPLVHVVSCEAAPADELLRSLIYFRGHGPSFTIFDSCGLFLDSVTTISALVRQDPNSDRVALIWPKPINPSETSGDQYNNDIVYRESFDRGLNWGPEINVTNYQYDDLERAYANISALYTTDGCLHIVWDAPGYDAAEGTVTTMANKLRHWDDCAGCISLIVDADNFQSCLPGRWNYNATKQNLSECDGRLYLTYTYFAGDIDSGTEDCSQNGFANGEIYVQASVSGGLTWGEPINLTNTPDNGCVSGGCESEHWSSSAMYSDDSLYILYVGDRDAGGWAGGDQAEGFATENPMMFLTFPCVPMDVTVALAVEPEALRYPLNATPGTAIDTSLILSNVGNVPVDFAVTIEYSTGADWLSIQPMSGNVLIGCSDETMLEVSLNAPTVEGLYQAEIVIAYDEGATELRVPVDLYCFATFQLPETAVLRTDQSRLAVQQVGRVAAQQADAGFRWFSDNSNFLFDASLIIGTGRDNLSFEIFHELSAVAPLDNPWKRLYAQSLLVVDSTSFEGYRYAVGFGCNSDSTIGFTSQYFAPKQADSGGFYIAHFDLYAGAHFQTRIENLMIAFAADWDIPSDTGADNSGGVDAALQLVYQQGQYPGSADLNDMKYGGVAYRGDDSSSQLAAGGFTWENDVYVYPNEGYQVDSLEKYLPQVSGWEIPEPDSVEDLSSILVVTSDGAIDVADTLSFSIIIAASNDGEREFSLAGLTASVEQGADFICNYVTPDAPHCPSEDCFCGDADGNNVINISDAVFLIAYIFGGAPAPDPMCLGDADGNSVVNISDVVYLIAYIFGGGPPPGCDG